ncbi:MAG: hypothetical protein QOG82_800 [Actinomycetota bacterium]|nr:hypothetical protein [Actinomycetota bacterium]
MSDQPRRPEDLTADERTTLHRAHQWLRNASSALEALTATDPIRGRWAPAPAPDEALDGARADLRNAYAAIVRHHQELFGWDDSVGPAPTSPPPPPA